MDRIIKKKRWPKIVMWDWGTYIMGFEHILEPPRRLQYAWDQMKPENVELKIMKMGETFTFDINPLTGDTQN
jgi:hypothetical protein